MTQNAAIALIPATSLSRTCCARHEPHCGGRGPNLNSSKSDGVRNPSASRPGTAQISANYERSAR